MIDDKLIAKLTRVEGISSLPGSIAEDLAKSIGEEAMVDAETGRQVLALQPESGSLVRFDLFKAISAAANVLKVALPLFGGAADITSILAALAALGSLQGLKSDLPKECGLIVSLLLPEKKTARRKLKELFEIASTGDRESSEIVFDQAVRTLERTGCIRVAENEIRLVESVLIRRR